MTIMRRIVLSVFLAAFWTNLVAAECIIMNEEKILVGSHKGVKGLCSNNRLPVTCILMEGTGIECDGPSGGYTGGDLGSLVFSACGCSIEQEKEQQLKQQFEAK